MTAPAEVTNPAGRTSGIEQATKCPLLVAELAGQHRLKYSLYYGRAGERLVGYDKERRKGDHKQLAGRELRYRFVSVEQLVADFLADIESVRQDELQPKE